MCLPRYLLSYLQRYREFSKQLSLEGLKNTHLGKKITTTPFQFAIMLDTDYLVAMDSEKYLSKTKRRNFEDF